jgi:hypothetical protein
MTEPDLGATHKEWPLSNLFLTEDTLMPRPSDFSLIFSHLLGMMIFIWIGGKRNTLKSHCYPPELEQYCPTDLFYSDGNDPSLH